MGTECLGVSCPVLEPPQPPAVSAVWLLLTAHRPLLWSSRYPHDVVNHLSCDEARNHYGGVVSLIPIVLDLMKEWIAHSEKLPRKVLQHVSELPAQQQATAGAARPVQATGPQLWLTKHKCQLAKDGPTARGEGRKFSKPPWRPPGGKL